MVISSGKKHPSVIVAFSRIKQASAGVRGGACFRVSTARD
jgi:hypothetical protein